MSRIIALWSAPRCRSTAFLRMMQERGDFLVIHEPFSHVTDFGEASVGTRQAHSEAEVIGELTRLSQQGQPVFFKDTTDFRYPGLLADSAFLRQLTHVFIIREPAAAIASHYQVNPDLRRDEIGFAWLHEIFESARAATGAIPLVIDADELVADPAAIIRACCTRIGIPFLPGPLRWAPRMDEQWRRTARWHSSVSASSGFEPARAGQGGDVARHPVLSGYLRYHQPYYRKMHDLRLRPEPVAGA
jgi:hypothetical protein